MTTQSSRYDSFVEHPRYGRGPRLTGLDPDRSAAGVFVHWNAINPDEVHETIRRVLGWAPPVIDNGRRRIPGTAIAADPARQQKATVQVTHYYDVERQCCDCQRKFIFFALEQKHWYETLRFPLEADAIRCPACRKRNQFIGRRRSTYDRLQKMKERSATDTVHLVDALLTLIENGVFGVRQVEQARHLIKALAGEPREGFLQRIRAIEELRGPANSRSSRDAVPRTRRDG